MILSQIKAKLRTIQKQLLHRLYIGPRKERNTIDEFHKLWYYSNVAGKTWSDTWWMGIPVLKCPFDLWIYQEIVSHLRPDLIIETGTYKGGTAHFLASLCDLMQHGEIVTIDIDTYPERREHARITYLHGSSTDASIMEAVRSKAANKATVLVLLDSDHTKPHVLRELELYAPLVTKGSYLIVEDSNINANPVLPGWGPGPAEAIEEFLRTHTEFEVDRSQEKFLLTFNPGGYLLRR